MHKSRVISFLSLFALMQIALCLPAQAWLYDGGGPNVSGAQLKEGSSTVWASEGFKIQNDSLVTSFGASIARGFGSSQTGFRIYLTSQRYSSTTPVMASGTILPLGVAYSYVYVNLSSPVLLRGGQKYYLTLAPNSNNFIGSVNWSYTEGADFGITSGDHGQTWYQAALPLAVRVDGRVVPETETWLALGVGLAGFAGMILLRRRCESQAGVDPA